MTFKKIFSGLTLAACVSLLSGSALAADANGVTISAVGVDATGAFYLTTSSGFFWARETAGEQCSTKVGSIEAKKMWVSIAQAAMLSGKKVNIVYNPCSSGNAIVLMQLI
jgi:hypothetical protein